MGRRPCCEKVGLNRGPWTALEDQTLKDYIIANGAEKWRDLPTRAGLKRCGKSCRLRWVNYLNPEIKRGNICTDEEDLIVRLHKLLGNRWSLIAGRLPGRTDNEIKNYWNTILCKKVQDQPPPPKRKPRKKSKKINSTGASTTNLPALASSDTIVSPQPSLGASREAMSSTLSNSVDLDQQNHHLVRNCFENLMDLESVNGYEFNSSYLDEYFMFLLSDQFNGEKNDEPHWEEDTYQDISSKHTLFSDDYWSSSSFLEQDDNFDFGSMDTLFQTQELP